jgi:hypothetical protein
MIIVCATKVKLPYKKGIDSLSGSKGVVSQTFTKVNLIPEFVIHAS